MEAIFKPFLYFHGANEFKFSLDLYLVSALESKFESAIARCSTTFNEFKGNHLHIILGVKRSVGTTGFRHQTNPWVQLFLCVCKAMPSGRIKKGFPFFVPRVSGKRERQRYIPHHLILVIHPRWSCTSFCNVAYLSARFWADFERGFELSPLGGC